MESKDLKSASVRERDERWKHASQSMVAERKEAFVRDGEDPAKAERRAKQMQEGIDNRAREQAER